MESELYHIGRSALKAMKYPQMFIIITAIICITTMMCYALHLGYDGLLIAGACAIVAGIAGFEVKPLIELIRPKKKPE